MAESGFTSRLCELKPVLPSGDTRNTDEIRRPVKIEGLDLSSHLKS